MLKKFSIFFLGFAVLSVQAQTSADPLKTTQYTLKNGLTVMLTENHNTPQIFGVVAVKAGGKNDPKEATGMAHYLEHMLFKGTEEMGTWDYQSEKVHLDKIEALYEELGKTTDEAKRAEIQKKINDEAILAGKYAIPNEMDRMLSEIGGTNVNAFTTEDFTAYHNEFPSNKLEHWLKIYDHRFEKPVFRLFQSELETVYEEKNRSMDSPFSEVIDVFNKNFWKNHPYGQQPIIGHTEHLKNPSLQKMYEYFNTYYVANNMVLALSGDFDTQEAIRLIEMYYSDWRTGTVPVFPEYAEAEFKGAETVEIKATPIKAMLRGYRAPKNNHPDQLKLQIANYMLSNGEGSGLLDMLGTDGKLSYAGMMPMEYNDYSASIIFAVPKIVGQDFPEAEKLMDEQLDLLRKGSFDQLFFEGAKTSLIKDFERQLERNDSRALMLITAFTANVSWDAYLKNYLELKNITKEDIVAVTNKYYGPNYLALYSRMGTPKKDKLNKPAFEPVIPVDGKVSAFAQTWRQTETPGIQAKFVDFQKDIRSEKLADLVTLKMVNNPYNQIFNLEFSWGIGTDHNALLFYLPNYLNKLGTASKNATEFKKALFEVGASMYFHANDNTFRLSVEGVDSKYSETIALVMDFLKNCKEDQKAIKILADEIKSERKMNNEDLGMLLSATQAYALYGKDSRYLRELSAKEIEKITAKQFTDLFSECMGYELNISYVGTKPGSEIVSSVKKVVEIKTPSKAKLPKKVLAKQGFDSPKVYFLNDKKAVQSQINFMIDGAPMKPDVIGNMKAFNLYFGADMSSLVFQEIREFRSLAYSTNARYQMAEKPGQNSWFYAYVGCQGDKTPEAIQVMSELITNMPVKREREDGIRSSLISDAKTSRPGFRELISSVERWEEMGFSQDPNKNLLTYFSDLSFDQIESFYSQEIKGRPMQIFVVGNSGKFDTKTLEKYGKIIKVKPTQVVKN
ncbi:MAG: Peptidase [Crocinitomicaceae bacterium]|jgi:predicted Zn-dependent peptidase|nr:Peptidase [Crocinitomicaceae bacterium]